MLDRLCSRVPSRLPVAYIRTNTPVSHQHTPCSLHQHTLQPTHAPTHHAANTRTNTPLANTCTNTPAADIASHTHQLGCVKFESSSSNLFPFRTQFENFFKLNLNGSSLKLLFEHFISALNSNSNSNLFEVSRQTIEFVRS